MQENQAIPENHPEYKKYATALVSRYRPTLRQACEVTSWPDEMTNRDLEITDSDTNRTVADVRFDMCPDGHAEVIIPVDYKRPKEREPIVSIDAPEQLPPAGELIYKIIERVDWIIVSPFAELTEKRELAGMFNRLHQNHSYSLETIQKGLIEEAQTRGDLPNDS